MFFFMFLFMTFYQCFFIMFLNKRIEEISIIYYVLPHSIFRRAHWGNPYHLLCASPLYFPTGALGKPLSFTMCFPTLFPDGRTGETPIIYYVLPHPIPRRTHWGNPYHLLCASPPYSPTGALGKPLPFTMCFPTLFPDFLWKHAWAQPPLTGETSTIYYVLPHTISRFSLKTRMGPIRSYWGNPYHLLCASPSYSSIFFENTHGPNPLLLGKSLPFTMCFPILFPGGRTGETPIIYYVLHHRVHPILRRAHCHWGTLYYFVCASPSCSSASALPLGKPLLFSGCFPSYRCSRLGIDPDRGRCQAIPRDIGETSII